MTVRGTLDGTPPRFHKMTVQVSATDVDRNQMEKMVLIAERGCIVANSLKQAMDQGVLRLDRVAPSSRKLFSNPMKRKIKRVEDAQEH